MGDRPILFSAPMVRALLAGTKSQTRRPVKLPHQNPLGVWEPQTIGGPNGGRTAAGETIPEQGVIWHTRTGESIGCPYGQPGDRHRKFAGLWRFVDDGQTTPGDQAEALERSFYSRQKLRSLERRA